MRIWRGPAGPLWGSSGWWRTLRRRSARRRTGRRVLDFGDLEHLTLGLLVGKSGSPTAVARELGSRFREVMVDEYQDSNAVQDAIYGALTSEKRNCFMVGT